MQTIKTLNIQKRVQHLMPAAGMLYAIVQVAILVYAGVYLLPLLGPPDSSAEVRYQGYAQNHSLFKIGNYLMGLPAPFFFIFLGGVYSYFHRMHVGLKPLLLTALLSGAVLIMIWPFGAIVSVIGVDIAAAGGDRITGGAFDSIVPYSLGLSTLPRAVFLLALSVLLLPNRWMAISGIVIAILSLLGNLIIASGTFLPFSLGSALLFQVWVFCLSLKMYRTQEPIQYTSHEPVSGISVT